jgi:peptidoglycan/LPS O-acetylase OafA/YrhL
MLTEPKIKYRAEIDGLRAIAVLSVIFYHSGKSIGSFILFSGGFLGVDIFFVISGYLITSIILNEIYITKNFSFINFYQRRARRILPALLFVIFASIFFSYLFLLPSDFIDYTKSIFYSLFFTSNYFFYFSEQIYDATPSLLIPFLHTWSLSVEEQFYLLYPIILYFSFKYLKNFLNKILFSLILISFFSMVYYFYANQSLAFFNFLTRFWELLVGAFIANNQKKINSYNFSILRKNIITIFGLFLIVFSILFFNKNISYGYIYAFFSIIGVSLIISFQDKEILINKILTNRFLVFIGLISYSLYLWHYPIFAFGRITELFGDGISKKLFFLTFFFSLFTFYFIEKPFRNYNFIYIKKFLFLIFFLYLVLLIFIYLSLSGKITPIRNDNLKILNTGNNTSALTVCNNSNVNKEGYCIFNEQYQNTIISVGDSHMQTLEKSLLDFADNNNFKFIIINKPACFYILDVNLFSKGKKTDCDIDYNNKVRSIIMSNNNSVVILGGRMTLYLTEDGFDNKESHYEGKSYLKFYDKNRLIENFQERKYFIKKNYEKTLTDLINNNHKVVLIYPVPEVGFAVTKKLIINLVKYSNDLAKLNQKSPLTTSYDVFLNRNKDTFDIFDFVKDVNILRIYPHKILCDINRCSTHNNKDVFYIDDDHLSLKGSELIIHEISRNLNFFKK